LENRTLVKSLLRPSLIAGVVVTFGVLILSGVLAQKVPKNVADAMNLPLYPGFFVGLALDNRIDDVLPLVLIINIIFYSALVFLGLWLVKRRKTSNQ